MFQKLKDNKDKILRGLFFLGIFIFGFFTTYLSLKTFNPFKKTSPSINLYTNATPEPIDEEKGVFNILLLGYGGAGHSGGGLTDSIIVAHINTNTKKYALVSIPRDMWTQNGRKINAEASVNGFPSVGASIQGVTDLSIDNYVAIDFSNFTKMIDNLGKIEVSVPAAFTDSFYPIPGLENETCGITEEEIFVFKNKYSGFDLEKQFTCRYEKISYDKGPATLTGTEALKFVRSRHGDSDFGRSARQFAVLKGIVQELISLKSLNKLDETVGILTEMIKTDLTLGKIKTLIEVFGDPSGYSSTEIQLTTENVLNEGKSSDGQYILYPKAGMTNFTEVKNYIKGQI